MLLALDDFEIIIHGASSILVEAKVDVIFFYDKDKQKDDKKRKKLHIFGPESAVKERALMVIERKKNQQAAVKLTRKFMSLGRKQGYKALLNQDKIDQ